MKKIVVLFLLAALAVGFCFGAQGLFERANNPALPRISDQADCLSTEEETKLLKTIEASVEDNHFDIVVLTLNQDVGDERAYARDFYTSSGYGYSSDNSGAILLINLNSGVLTMEAFGYGEKAIGTYGIDRIEALAAAKASRGNYGAAAETFAKLVDKFYCEAKSGEPYSESKVYRTLADYLKPIIYCAVFGCAVGLIVVVAQKSRLKTAVPKRDATGYMDDGSLTIQNKRDVFISSTVTKTKAGDKNGGEPKAGDSAPKGKFKK